MKQYPRAFHPLLLAVLGLLFCSGFLLLPHALSMRLEWDVPWQLPSAWRVAIAASHALAFMLTLLFLGALWTLHMRSGWLRGENRRSGLILISLFALLMFSGLGLYYLGEDMPGRIAFISHALGGLAVPLILLWHVIGAQGVQARAQRRARTSDPVQTATAD